MNAHRTPIVRAQRAVLRDGEWSDGERALPEETPVAFVVDGAAEAVMMATPADLEDFALGFALSEGLIAMRGDLQEVELLAASPSLSHKGEGDHPIGIEARLWLSDEARKSHVVRRRTRAGPAGCGLCGVESLEAALPPCAPVVSDFTIGAGAILAAMAQLPALQPLNQDSRAVHAAGFFTPGEGIVCVREDVGRHNALDKLVGALARQGRDCSGGIILMSSRVSIELIQKAARARAPVLAAVSAPTALAVRAAEAAGICVCGIVRENGLEIFTRPGRIVRNAD